MFMRQVNLNGHGQMGNVRQKRLVLEPGECSNKSLSNYFREHRLHDLPSLFLDEFQMFLTAHAFCVNFAEVFSSRWPHSKPTVLRNNFEPADLSVIARCARQLRSDGFTR